MVVYVVIIIFFFFKQKTAYEMRISDWSSDVCSSDLIGSVRLTEQMVIERYSHVMHIVSNVTGRLKEGFDALHALAATFPAGTLSGAPKVRAMEIIDRKSVV